MSNNPSVENNTARVIYLPPVMPLFPLGIRLLPAYVTEVPQAYFDALYARAVVGEPSTVIKPDPKGGTPKAEVKYPEPTCPGVEQIERLKRPTRIYKFDGVSHGPQITIYEPGQGAVGPRMPHTLAEIHPTIASDLIKVCNDREALERFAKEGHLKGMQAAAAEAKMRLRQLGY